MPSKGTIPRVCEACSTGFLAQAGNVKRGYGRFCSESCRVRALKKSVTLLCQQCGAPFTVKAKRAGVAKFCGRKCHYAGRRRPRPDFQLIDDGKSALIPLFGINDTITGYTVVDAADAEWANQWRWNLVYGYARRSQNIGGTSVRGIRLHRELMGLTRGDGLDVDHIDRNRLNNRRSNLRIVTRTVNPQNYSPRKGASSRFRGVHWHKNSRKWVANVSVNSQKLILGYFDDEHAAAEAAKLARARYMPYAVD